MRSLRQTDGSGTLASNVPIEKRAPLHLRQNSRFVGGGMESRIAANGTTTVWRGSEVKSRRTVSSSARVVTTFTTVVQTGRTCCTTPKHSASRWGRWVSPPFLASRQARLDECFAIRLRDSRSHESQARKEGKGAVSDALVGTPLPPFDFFLY